MNKRKREALFLLTVSVSCAFVLFLVVIKKHSSYLALSSRSSWPWDDDDDWYWSESEMLSYSYSGSVIYPSPTPDVDPTCRALQQLAGSTGVCTPNDQCNGIHCTVPGAGSFDLTVEPCHNPPAVNVVGRNPSNEVIFNQTLTQSRRENLGPGTIDVSVEQSSLEDSVIIGVTAHVGPLVIPIIPNTRIPLNRQQCDFVPHTPTTSQPIPSPSPTPTPGVDPTCQTLTQLASTYPLCSVNEQCSGLHCGVVSAGSFDLTVEPCHNPPAVNVVGRNSSNEVVFNETLTQSRQENLGLGTIDVHVEQSPDEDAIFIGVNYTVFAGFTVPIVPRTRIPLNRDQCGFTPRPPPSHTATPHSSTSTPPPIMMSSSHPSLLTPPFSTIATSVPVAHTPPIPTITTSVPVSHTSPISTIATSVPVAHTVRKHPSMSHSLEMSSVVVAPPTKPSSGGGTSLTVAVAVPVSIILCLVGGVVMAVAIVLAVKRHKRIRREYHFQRMTFSDDRDDDDDEVL